MWLFFEGNEEVKTTGDDNAPAGSTSAYETAKSTLEQIEDMKDAFGNFVASATNMKTVIENANKSMTLMEGSSLALQRSMGGVATGTDAFREKLTQAYYKTIELGTSFQDSLDAVAGIAGGMGRMVNPSQETLENMLVLSKSTGMASKDIGGMVTDLVRFGGTQLEATKKIETLSKSARSAGLNAASFIKNIQTDLKKVSGFGFKNGVDGLSKMVKQAMLLRTTVQAIGAQEVQNTALDPEGAIELAANFQMLGGAVGKLADPFQLMYMAQNDVEGLQNELVNSTKAAMSFNKETGKFDVSTEDMYRLRQQAKLTNSNLEDLVNTGREAAKLDYLKEKFDLGNLDEDTQGLVAGLAEIGEGGKVSIDIPGFKKLEADTADGLKAQLQSADAQKALKDYQDKAAMSEKDLAIAQQTISEKQAVDVNIIKEAVIKGLTADQRTELKESIKNLTNKVGESFGNAATPVAGAVGSGLVGINNAASASVDKFVDAVNVRSEDVEALMKQVQKTFEDGNTGTIPAVDNLIPSTIIENKDLFLGSGSAPVLLNEGDIYKGIVGDEVAIGTGLSDAFNISNRLTELIGSQSGNLQTQNVGGAIDININVGGAVSGDKNADVSKIFNDPRVQKQIMDTVLYKLDAYKRQQGVLK